MVALVSQWMGWVDGARWCRFLLQTHSSPSGTIKSSLTCFNSVLSMSMGKLKTARNGSLVGMGCGGWREVVLESV